MIENWKPIPDFNYEVSDLGRVRNQQGHIMAKHIGPTGQNLLFLRKGSKYKLKTVARLVAEAFIPNPDNLKFVKHLDKKSDDKASNLKWAKNSALSKLSDVEIKHIKETDMPYEYFMSIYKISKSTVQKIRNGKTGN